MDSLKLKTYKKLYLKAKENYYNNSPIMSDAKFDELEDIIKKHDPDWEELHKTGVEIRNKKMEVTLIHFMPSLTKHYPHQVNKFLDRYPDVIVMDKLDGSSLQLVYNKGKPTKLVTRGNGILGQDISYLIPHLNIPTKLRNEQNLVLRCEAVISKEKFEKYTKKGEKREKNEFEDPRAMVNGFLNRKFDKKNRDIYKDIDIVVLAVYGKSLERGLEQAFRAGFNVVYSTKMKDINPSSLSSLLKHRKEKNQYNIDGLVLADANNEYMMYDQNKPKWTTAFKDNNEEEEAVTATVEKIIYQISKHGRIIPKIQITPIKVGNINVKHATANNAKWMIDRGIGPGAQIKIIRSGDVIPKIVDVIKKGKIQYPKVDYSWDGVHLITNNYSDEQKIKEISSFLRILGVEFIASKTVKLLYDQNILTSPIEYFKIVHDKDISVFHKAGLGPNISQKIYKELQQKLSKVEIKKLAIASSCFDAGVGLKRLNALQKAGIPLSRLLKMEHINTITNEMKQVSGFSDKIINLILNGLNNFNQFVRNTRKYIAIYEEKIEEKKVKNGKFSGMKFSWTGYRSKQEEQFIEENGGEIVSFGSKTTHLLIAKNGKKSGKIDKAREKGIKVVYFEDL